MTTQSQFVKNAVSALGSKYWYASSGQKPTKEYLESLFHGQFAKKWTPARRAKAFTEIGKGEHVFDCIGLVRWCSGMEKNIEALNTNADVLRVRSNAKPLSTRPEEPGICLFLPGHVGIYRGKNRVIECWGFQQVDDHAIGFQKWTHWGYCPWVTYEKTPAPVPEKTPEKVPEKAPEIAPEGGKVPPKELAIAEYQVGDRVRVKKTATEFEPGVRMKGFVPGSVYTVAQIAVRKGVPCVLLKEIESWCREEHVAKEV